MKSSDTMISGEVTDVMEKMVKRFGNKIFHGIDLAKVRSVHLLQKRNARIPLVLKPVPPIERLFTTHVYTVVVAHKTWVEMSEKKKNLAVFRTMCGFPEGAFDEASKNYGKKRKPDYEMYSEEFAVSGGVPNWMENEEAIDPLQNKDDKIARKPITAEAVATA